jgi:hypothetical protein
VIGIIDDAVLLLVKTNDNKEEMTEVLEEQRRGLIKKRKHV